MRNNLLLFRMIISIIIIFIVTLLFRNFNFLGYIDPFIFLLYIILFPSNKKTELIISSFVLAFGIDLLYETGGIFIVSIGVTAYIRNFLLSTFIKSNSINYFNNSIYLVRFALYVSSIVVVNNAIVFLLNYFSFDNFLNLFYVYIINVIFNIIFLLTIVFIFFSIKKNKY